MALKKLVKVCRPVFPPDGPWRAYDQKLEHMEEDFEPEPWVKEAVGARPCEYFYAIWSLDGWIIKKRAPKLDRHWFDAEGNPI